MSKHSNERKILCVGLSCIDIIQSCEEYVLENTEKRCIDLKYQRGGNASNSCAVLSQLGCPTEFLGVLRINDEFSKFLQTDLCKSNIDFSHCPIVEIGGCPISTVLLSDSTGSRTIIHHDADIEEVRLRDFDCLDLREYSWIHFEGRDNVREILSMIRNIRNHNSRFPERKINISVELEKPNSELLQLLPHADVAFISNEFAESRGYADMNETIVKIQQFTRVGTIIISAWSEKGATALGPDGNVVRSLGFPPKKIIDTLGAGDTFNAAILYCLNKRKTIQFIDRDSLQKIVEFGCKLAGAKIGLRGFEGLRDVAALL